MISGAPGAIYSTKTNEVTENRKCLTLNIFMFQIQVPKKGPDAFHRIGALTAHCNSHDLNDAEKLLVGGIPGTFV